MRIDRTLVVAMFVASGLSACSKTPAAFSEADRTSIQATVDSFTNAIKSGDYAAAASWYTVDAVFMPPNAPVVEERPAIQKTLESFGKVSAFSQPVVEVDGVGDLAYARVNFDLTFTPPNTTALMSDKGKVLIVMRKEADGKWRTSRGIFNSDLPLPGSAPAKR